MMIQLLSFPGCPNVDEARAAVREAIAAEGLHVEVEELDVSDPRTPAALRGWGSPTVLVDGRDVAGEPAGPTRRAGSIRVAALRPSLWSGPPFMAQTHPASQ